MYDSPSIAINPQSKFGTYLNAIAANPVALFWVFAFAHIFLWTIVPALVCANAPLDVIENYAWGREWLMGTHKHPPMQAWWLEVFAVVTDRASWAHFFASQIAVVISFWAVWQTGRRILDEKSALIGVVLLEGVVYYNFTSPEFNANLIQLPFWALSGWAFYAAVKDNRLADWMLLGLWSACSLYSKYSSILLLVTFGLLMLVNPVARRRLAKPGPYVTFLVTSLLFLPHFLWLIGNDFIPLEYAKSQIASAHNHSFPFLRFSVGQLAAVLPAIILFFAAFGRTKRVIDSPSASFDRAFVNYITFGPYLLICLIGIAYGSGVHNMWGTPFWNFFGLWVVFHFQPKFEFPAVRRFIYGWTGIFVLILVAYAGSVIISPYITHKTMRTQFPGHALAEIATDAWHARYNRPLKYVIGDIWPAGNISYYSPERPHVFTMANSNFSPWINIADLKREGGIIVWCVHYCCGRGLVEGAPDFVQQQFPHAEVQPNITLKRLTGADVKPVILGWAILAPEHEVAATVGSKE